MAITWPPLPPDLGISASVVDVIVAMPEITAAWGHAQWGVGRWGGYDFDTATSMKCDVTGITTRRGRNDPLEHVAAGTLNIDVRDPDRRWAPWVIPANGFRAWRTGIPIQVRSSEGVLFTGSVSTISADEAPAPDETRIVQVDARDPLLFLAASNQAEQVSQGSNELAGARLERIWAFARPPGWVEHRFDVGVARMQPTTLAREALTDMWLTADSDAGMLSCDPDGVVQYWDTDRGLTADRRVVPQYTFTDDDDLVAPTPMICASKFTVDDDQSAVINWVGIAAVGGTQEIAEDLTSQSMYGVKTTKRTDLIHNEGQAFSKKIAETFLSRVTRQSVVISPLVFDALGSPEAWEAAHFLDAADRVAVHRSADGHRLDVEASIDLITHDITPSSWFTTITLSPGTQRTAYTRWGRAYWGVDKWS